MDALPSDDSLLALAGAGDEQALAELYDRYGGPAYRLALRAFATGRWPRTPCRRGSSTSGAPPPVSTAVAAPSGGWIMTLVHRRAVDLVRRLERERCGAALPSDAPERTEPPVDDEAWLRERGEIVRAALGRLSAEQREPIELAYFDALTQTEIAQLLELPLGTVKSRTFAGLSRLRALLADAEFATVPEGRGRDRAPAGAT